LQTSFSLLPFTRQPVKVNAREQKNIHETQTDLIKTENTLENKNSRYIATTNYKAVDDLRKAFGSSQPSIQP